MDNSVKQSKRFAIYFFSATAVILSLIALTIYILDPFFQYRTRDNRYILNPIYTNPGLAKNHDYNMAIIGSSMVQNYDLSILREDSLVKPVKLASGAVTIREMKLLYSLVNKEKTNTFIFNLDMIQFNEWLPAFRYPAYLFEEGFLNRLQYLFAYESTVRYGLTDIILAPYMAFSDEENRPEKVKLRTKIDDIGNFSQDAVYNDIDRIKHLYHSGQTVAYPTSFQMNYRMKENIDGLLESLELDKHKDKEFIFVLPPYSALYWYITKRDKYFYHMMNNIKYLCKATEQYDNVKIQFFFNLRQITDLNRYSDVTHFDPTTSNYILENFNNDDYTITTKNMNQWLDEFDHRIMKFREENSDWL